jgi:hypothetical protein
VGAVERANQSLMRILKKLTNYGENDWRRFLNQATFAYNISLHRAINTSPYILKYGNEPIIIIKKNRKKQSHLQNYIVIGTSTLKITRKTS